MLCAKIPSYLHFLYLHYLSNLAFRESQRNASETGISSWLLILFMTPVMACGWPRDTIVYESTFPATKVKSARLSKLLRRLFFLNLRQDDRQRFFFWFSLLQWISRSDQPLRAQLQTRLISDQKLLPFSNEVPHFWSTTYHWDFQTESIWLDPSVVAPSLCLLFGTDMDTREDI